ncbi:transcriptional regulator ATRX-like [Thraustotheca clavata]|uniref:Transcriptional regulator ATRX-like n=1 Tax=Thraustotheca clavata TaxID=74557 RepID=A0A1V9ZQC4_9STRA|nr:transcriptional regulator ATRX-like [Thraustotheca clavata]
MNNENPKKKSKELSVPEKIALITHASRGHPTNSKLAKQFGVSSATVSRILKRKHEYLTLSKSLTRDNVRKRKFRSDSNALLNSLVYKWYQDSIARNMHVSGPMLRDKALRLAAELEITDFKASNGWIDNFRQRYHIGNAQAALSSFFDKVKPTEAVDEMPKSTFDHSFTSLSPPPTLPSTDDPLIERLHVLEQQIQAMQSWKESFERAVTCQREEHLALISEKSAAQEAQIESILQLLKDQPNL